MKEFNDLFNVRMNNPLSATTLSATTQTQRNNSDSVATTAYVDLSNRFHNTIGTLFNVSASTLSDLNSFTINVSTGTTTVSLSGGTIRFNRPDGALGFLDYAIYDSYGNINSKYWTFSTDFELKRLDSTSYGFGFGFIASATNATTDYVRCRLQCDSSGNKGTLTMEVNGSATAASVKLSNIVLNDRIKLTITRNNGRFTGVAQNMSNISTTTPVAVVNTILSRAASTGWQPTMIRPYFFNLGGTYHVMEFTLSTKQTSNTNIFIGDSITHGMFIDDNSKAYPELIEEITSLKCDNFGSTSTTTNDWLKAMTEVTARTPYMVYFLLGRNDVATSIPTATTLNNIATMISILTANTIDYRIISLLPTGSAYTNTMIALNTAFQTRYPTNYLDVQSYFNDGIGNMLSRFNSGDGTHMWEGGHQEMAKRLINVDTKLQQ